MSENQFQIGGNCKKRELLANKNFLSPSQRRRKREKDSTKGDILAVIIVLSALVNVQGHS